MRWRWSVIALMIFGATACATTPSDVALFNGRDLTGWSGEISTIGDNANGQKSLADYWTVSNGELHCAGGNAWSWVHTTEDYTNFRLHFEWRWDDRTPPGDQVRGPVFNSGALVRANPRNPRPPNIAMPAMYEAQISPRQQTTGDLWLTGYDHPDFHGERRIERMPAAAAASTTRAYSASAYTERPLGEWNAYEISFDGGDIELKINGQVVNEAQGAGMIPGKIGLECQYTPISFRNIRVTRLD